MPSVEVKVGLKAGKNEKMARNQDNSMELTVELTRGMMAIDVEMNVGNKVLNIMNVPSMGSVEVKVVVVEVMVR